MTDRLSSCKQCLLAVGGIIELNLLRIMSNLKCKFLLNTFGRLIDIIVDEYWLNQRSSLKLFDKVYFKQNQSRFNVRVLQ